MNDFQSLNAKFNNISDIPNKAMEQKNIIDIDYDFDELKMYFGEPYWVTDKISINCPNPNIFCFLSTMFFLIFQLLL